MRRRSSFTAGLPAGSTCMSLERSSLKAVNSRKAPKTKVIHENVSSRPAPRPMKMARKKIAPTTPSSRIFDWYVHRYAEEAEDDREDEDVVDREAAFDDVAGEVFARRRAAFLHVDHADEADADDGPDYGPQQRFFERDLVLAAKEEEVDRQHDDDEDR